MSLCINIVRSKTMTISILLSGSLIGQVYIVCAITVERQDLNVAWVNQDTGAVLSIGERVLTSNKRITVTQEQRNTWVLGVLNVTLDDSGEYMCQVSTTPPLKLFGNLKVVQSPIFEWHSQIRHIKEGSSASLECHARGHPTPTIEWKRQDGERIRVNYGYYKSVIKGRKLNLQNANAETVGSYVCIASNGHPPSVSRILKINVSHVPIVQILDENERPAEKKIMWVRKHFLAVISCRFAAHPQPRISFERIRENGQKTFFMGREVEAKNIYQQHPFTHIMTLTLPEILTRDYGNYSCIVKNEIGEKSDYIVIKELIIPAYERAVTTTSLTTMTETQQKTYKLFTAKVNGRPLIAISNTSVETNSTFANESPPAAGQMNEVLNTELIKDSADTEVTNNSVTNKNKRNNDNTSDQKTNGSHTISYLSRWMILFQALAFSSFYCTHVLYSVHFDVRF